MEINLESLMRDLGVSGQNRRFALRAAWYCVISLCMGYILGWFGTVGFPSPFAKETAILEIRGAQRTMSEELHQDRVERMDVQIFALVSSRCHAEEGSPARQTYTEQLEEIIRKYKRLTGEYPRVPECKEISQNAPIPTDVILATLRAD